LLHWYTNEWLLFNASSVFVLVLSWREHVTFDEMMMISALYWTNMHSWIFIVLVHWNHSLWVDMSLHSDTLSLFRGNWSLLFLLNAACTVEGETTNANFIVCSSTRQGLKPTIHHTQVEHSSHYTTDALHWYM